MSCMRIMATGVVLFGTIVVSNSGLAFAPPFPPAKARVDVSPVQAPFRKLITRVDPVYPPDAERLGIEADIDLTLIMNASGNVTKAERGLAGGPMVHHDDQNVLERAEFVANNPNAFRDAAVAAARQWKFEPSNTEWTCAFWFRFRLKPADPTEPKSGIQTSSGSPTPSAISRSARPGEVPSTPLRGPVRVGGDIKPPRKVVDVKPLYPDDARAAKAKGVVLLEMTIASDGSVSNARVLRSIPLFDQAAIDAVLQWKFDSTRLNGSPVEVEMLVFINFVPPSE